MFNIFKISLKNLKYLIIIFLFHSVVFEDVTKEVINTMTDADRRLHEETLKLVTQNEVAEKEILEKRKFGLDVDISVNAPKQSFEGKDNPTLRIFCSNFGLNSLQNWAHLLPLKTPNNTESILKPIDKLSE